MEPLGISLLAAPFWAFVFLLISAMAARLRFSASRGLRTRLDILFLLPLAIPEFAVLCAPFLDLGPGPSAILALDLIWAVPVFYLCAIMGFRKVSQETVDAARLQGLGQCGIFWRVFFPVAWPWLLASIGVVFIRGALLGGLLCYNYR
ncbi:MAG: ABC transporter permease subunit [Verrucomicrobia bacterium]|nr:ABC transporter permease subunit [Verrucomicrobiota bacterium]